VTVWIAFLLAFGALLPIINPLGSGLVFLGVVGSAPPALYRSLARRIAINNVLALGACDGRKTNLRSQATRDFTISKRNSSILSHFRLLPDPERSLRCSRFCAHVSSRKLSADLLGHSGIFAAVIIVSVLVYFCYAYAPTITTKVSRTTAQGILRVIAFIMLCIGVQIAWNGLSAQLKTVLSK
jgi:multiple antibiotic resistance protein